MSALVQTCLEFSNMNHQALYLHSPTLKLSTNYLFSSDTFSTPLLHINLNIKSKPGYCNFHKKASEFSIVTRNHRHSVSIIMCEKSTMKDDSYYMKRSVEIAKKAIGCTSPNPMVGCVIVKDGVVVGEGFHPKAGQPHAEVFALRDAGNLAENATAYVSLEPCNHYGRTPPCTEALIRAKVKRVVVGMVDPNPIVASKGVNKLRESGIDVTVGVEEESCKKLNEAYIHRMLTGKPFVTLRYSLSVNGRFSNKPGEYYSQLLQEYDGVIAISFPTFQEPEAKQPLQIIISKASNSIVFRVDSVDETVVLDELNLSAILDCCAQRGLCSVLLDLRGSVGELKEIVEEGFDNGLVQKVVMEILPVWGGEEEDVVLESLGKRGLKLKKMESEMIGETVVVHGYF